MRRILIFLLLALTGGVSSAAPPESYNIVWDSQSKGSVDSMPLSGRNLGLNVWVENDDLLFLIGSSIRSKQGVFLIFSDGWIWA